MATKVQSKNYLPGYYSLQDIKEGTTSSWSCYYQDKKLSEHLYNTYVPKPVKGYSEDDKEMLKRTMLEHEAIFRKQVYELHRLYRIQKDLMSEYQIRGFYGSSILAEASHSNSFSSQMLSEYTEKISQMSHLPVGKTSYGKTPLAGSTKNHLSFTREGSVQSDHIPLLNGASRKDTEALDYKSQIRRMFDLQLPADEYIDIEDTDESGQTNIANSLHNASIPKDRTYSLSYENDVKLTLGSGQREHQILNLPAQIDMSTCTRVDLNKPITEICGESPAHSASVQLIGLKTHNQGNQGHHRYSTRSNSSSTDRHGDQQTTSDLLHRDVHTKREWPFFNLESGENRSNVEFFAQAYNDNAPKPSETLQLYAKKPHEIYLSIENRPDTWSRQEPTHNIQTSLRVPHFTCSYSALMSPSMPSSSSITTPRADLTNCAPSFVSSWRKPAISISDTSIAVLAHPCFNGSSNLSTESLSSKIDAQIPITCQKWQNSRNLTTHLGSGIRVSHTNGFHHGLHLDSNYSPHPKVPYCKPDKIDDDNGNLRDHLPENYLKCSQNRDLKIPINLNQHQAFLSGNEDGLPFRQDKVIYDYDKVSGAPSWLRKKSSSNESVYLEKHASRVDFSLSNEHPQPIFDSNIDSSEIERKEKEELDLSVCNLRVASSSEVKYQKIQGNDVYDNIGKRIHGFPIHDMIQQSSISVSILHMEKQLIDNTKFMGNDNMSSTGLACNTKVMNSQKKVHIGDSTTEICGGRSRASFRNHINLNAEFACTDDPTSSDILPQSEVVVQTSYSMPSLGVKVASVIDLEVPISQVEMGILNQHSCIPSSKKVGSEEKDSSGDSLIRLAAENLVSISLECSSHSNETNPQLLSLPQCDTLCWFAEFVSCSAENSKLLGNGGDGSTPSSDDDGLDSFEAMTLKLQEIKVDQYWPRPKELENIDEKDKKEVIGAAQLLFTKPRRGQVRKRRLRRDFQKDILPGLASLSRHEVTEDLQTIGGMMKASGRPWQTGLTRRSMGRNGMNFHTKGRQQLRSSDITVEEILISSHPPSQPSGSEIVVNGTSMIGWGRTTRRCRRQRCLPSNLSAPLT